MNSRGETDANFFFYFIVRSYTPAGHFLHSNLSFAPSNEKWRLTKISQKIDLPGFVIARQN